VGRIGGTRSRGRSGAPLTSTATARHCARRSYWAKDRKLIRPFAGDMAAWPVSTRVNKADNDAAAILDRVEAAA
jgi:putative SOS response-associated peptidase YedK